MGSPLQPHSSEPDQPPLRIVFMGTPALAAHILERLVDSSGPEFEVVGVVTRPDQPRKRGLKLEPSEVGAVAKNAGIPTLKPTKIRTAEFLQQLKSFAPDVLAVAAYGRILPNAVLETAMPINVHASLLPRHRGAAPIEGAILAGDGETGVTIMRITEQMDAGPILLARSIPLSPGETQGSLKQKLAELGAAAFIEALRKLRRGELEETQQDESLATYTSPIKKEDGLIDWSSDAALIERMVRAYDPWPVARSKLNDEELLIWKARIATAANQAGPGTLVEVEPAPLVQCGKGALELIEVQAPGRRRMGAPDFFRGRRIERGVRLG
jgi:methionyl-tRNA formyltransferase